MCGNSSKHEIQFPLHPSRARLSTSMSSMKNNIISHKLVVYQMYTSLTKILETLLILIFFILQSLFIFQKRDLIYHCTTASIFIFLAILKRCCISSSPSSDLYLVDFSCLKPPNFCRVPSSTYLEHVQKLDFLNQESVSFMSKILTHSGHSEQTYLPPAIFYIPPKSSQGEAIKEVHMVLFPVLKDLFHKTKVSPCDIDVLIVNCSGFCPSPSLSSIVVNEFRMRENVKSYTLSGMGCSASAIAVDMAANIMKTRENCSAVILSTEILSTGWYPGKDQTMMSLNCVFRMGAAAILVSNKKESKGSAKYKMVCSLRTQRAFDDKGYYGAMREEDGEGLTGVTMKRDLLQVVAKLLRSNIGLLGLKLLPYTEIIAYVFSRLKKYASSKSTDIHAPNFKRIIQHFCLPTSSKALIFEMGKGLKINERDMEPALMTLHRFGNQSSSSLWYELSYMEAKERIKKGDRVLQLGLGSGLKCSSLVWECVRPTIMGEARDHGVWADVVDAYPVKMVEKRPI